MDELIGGVEEVTQAVPSDYTQIREGLKRDLDATNAKVRESLAQVAGYQKRREELWAAYRSLSRLVGEEVPDLEPIALPSSPQASDLSLLPPSASQGAMPKAHSNPYFLHPVLKHVYDILRTAPKPMHYRNVFEELQRLGVKIPGQLPMNNLSTYMSRAEHFERIGKGVYRLKK